MSESLRGVKLEVAQAHIPELMTVLGDFAAKYDIGIEFYEPTADPAEDAPRFNPDWAMLLDDGNGNRVQVVTKGHLLRYEGTLPRHEFRPGLAERTYNAIAHNATRGDGVVLPYVLLGGESKVRGLRVETLPELADGLVNKTADVTNLGKTASMFLHKFCGALYPAGPAEPGL